MGKPLSSFPTLALVISRPILEKNLTCLQVTQIMLDRGKHRSIVASTVYGIEGVLPLAKEGLLDEVGNRHIKI